MWLSGDLNEYHLKFPQGMLLQYVDDLLIRATNMDACTLATEGLLEPLQWLRYWICPKKAQLCTMNATYL